MILLLFRDDEDRTFYLSVCHIESLKPDYLLCMGFNEHPCSFADKNYRTAIVEIDEAA